MATIRNPVDWSVDQVKAISAHSASIARALASSNEKQQTLPAVRKIGLDDLRISLLAGIDDFKAARTDVLALSIIYPIAGLFLWWVASNYEMLPLLFPLISGFALLGPVAAIGLYEMSRQHEAGKEVSWLHALDVVKSPSFGSIIVMAFLLLALFLIWLGVAQRIYIAFLGAQPPQSIEMLLNQVLGTSNGRAMALTGIFVGFLFALTAFTISAVSFPMLLDRHVGPNTAIVTSVRAVLENPLVMAAWGIIIAASLLIASIPLFFGLIVAVPVLGHASWHLYRRLVEPPGE